MNASALAEGQEVFVHFEDIQEIARVFVNGKDCGIVWTPPYRANITQHIKPGTNQITVQVANTWNNRIVGDMRNPGATSYTSTNATSRFDDDQPLLESGLLDRAEILIVE